MSRSSSPLPLPAVVIRPAHPQDDAALIRLAALDSSRPLQGAVHVAERDGRLLAAISADDGRTVADPFSPTADLVALLRVRIADGPRAARRSGVRRRLVTSFRRRPALARG